jgi:hypothetical protein
MPRCNRLAVTLQRSLKARQASHPLTRPSLLTISYISCVRLTIIRPSDGGGPVFTLDGCPKAGRNAEQLALTGSA